MWTPVLLKHISFAICIYLNHSKMQAMHNTEKSPTELGRKHETCAWKYCSMYYFSLQALPAWSVTLGWD